MSGSSYSIASTVVLYNPPDEVLNNILSYLNQVSKVYVIDNSVQPNYILKQKLEKTDKVIYIDHEGNKGIAAALNTGAQRAMIDGFELLLTMDQDTAVGKNFVSGLMEAFMRNNPDQVGIIAPRYTERSKDDDTAVQQMLFIMTSGNILNLQAYKKTGPFLNKLFIDHVDHEYCLRLNERGYKVIQVNTVKIIHRPGTVKHIFARKLSYSSHSPLRLYYFCRNGFYVANRYRKNFPGFKYSFYKQMLKEMCKIPFEKNSMLRVRMIIKAYLDYKADAFGPLQLRDR